MSDDKYKLLQNLANSLKDQEKRKAAQDVALEQFKINQMSPEQQDYYKFSQQQDMMGQRPHDPLAPQIVASTPEEAALLDAKAAEARKKYDAVVQPSQSFNPLFPNLNKLVRK